MTTYQPTVHAQSRDARAPQSLRQAWVALAGLSAVFLFEMLDNSILNVALPSIGRELHSSTTALQWVTGSYSVVFGGLMIAFAAIADRFGRRRMMLTGLILLALASFSTAFVTSTGELIAVRVATGIAAAMTTPGTMGLAFTLFTEDGLRTRAITLISTVGMVGLAVAPTASGLVLAVAPWQVLLLVNVPIALLAFAGVWRGIPRDRREDLHPEPIDLLGAVLGTLTVVLALLTPTFFVDEGAGSVWPWLSLAGALALGVLFVWRQRRAAHPLLDFELIRRPLVSSGLAFKSAAGMATAGLTYLVTLQLQFTWGYSPALAGVAQLPQVAVLILGGFFVSRFIQKAGFVAASWLSSLSVVAGLAVFAGLGRFGYIFVAIALVLVAAGLRVVGVVAGMNVMRGLPSSRSTMGAALVDTSSEIATGASTAVVGTIVAALLAGSIGAGHFTALQLTQLQSGITVGAVALTVIAAVLVLLGFLASRKAAPRG